MARMLVIYKTPQDPAAFDKHYFEVHIPLAKKLPGIRKYEVSRGAVTTLADGEAYMVAILTFDSVAAIKAAFASEAGAACAADRRHFAPDPAQFQMFLFDDQEV
ncbi:MAG TPA: EthD family reductase [Stellaceae bacterium]|nr:EthD family reductase [Stellaceae bacterium]